MFSINNKISTRQIKMMTIVEVFSTASLVLPKLIANTSDTLGWIPITIGGIALLLYGLLLMWISNKIKTGFVDFARSIVGNVIGTIIAGFFIIKMVFAAAFALLLFAKITSISMLPLTPGWIIILCMLLISVWGACKGLEVRARIGEILFWIIIIPIVLILLLAIPQLKIDRIVASSDADLFGIMKGSYITFMVCSAIELFLFTAPYTDKKKKNKKSILYVSTTILILNLALYFTTIGLFGSVGTGRLEVPTINIMQNVKFPGSLIERMDAFMVSFWILSIFSIICSYVFHLSTLTKELFRGGKQENLSMLFGAIIFVITLVVGNYENATKLFPDYMTYVGMPSTVISILIISLILFIRRDKAWER